MKIKLSDLRAVIKEAITLYHGSPYRGIKKFTDYRGRIPFVFFTPSHGTALDYTKALSNDHAKTNASRVDPGDSEQKPTIYKVEIGFNESQVFDTGSNDSHRQLYKEFAREMRRLDSEDIVSGLQSTPVGPGGHDRVNLPTWAVVQRLFEFVVPRGFRGVWFSEGSQGPSLAIRLEDANLVDIVAIEELD